VPAQDATSNPQQASPQEAKRAYRNKAKLYHPDVVSHLSPAKVHKSEEKFKELTEAYGFFSRRTRPQHDLETHGGSGLRAEDHRFWQERGSRE